MMRRLFLSLGFGVLASLLPLPKTVVAAPRGPWQATGHWWEKEFDFGRRIGWAGEARHVVTGETRRYAMQWIYESTEPYQPPRDQAKRTFRAWVDELNREEP